MAGSGKRATSVSWADLQYLGSQEEGDDSTLDAEDAKLLPMTTLSAERFQGRRQEPLPAAATDQAGSSDTRGPSIGPIKRGQSSGV